MDHILRYQANPDVKMIVLLGEVNLILFLFFFNEDETECIWKQMLIEDKLKFSDAMKRLRVYATK